jgi:CBS domain-containing protein
MHVAGILNHKGKVVVTIGPNATVRHAVELMVEKNIGAVVIAGVDKKMLGIFSERDVVRLLARHGSQVLDEELKRHMTSHVLTCTTRTPISDIMHLMTNRKFRHVPVVEDEVLGGLISIGDVVKFRLEEVETEHKAMRDYIASA